ncbi:MAG: hypothetical protein IJU04_00085 [Ruminococcus sp.]|nr:hypothetical protein [Ruminococcus sp.]
MNDLQKTMKYSLVFGLSGAVIIPIIYEIYANISKTVGIVLVIIWAVSAGIMLSSQKLICGIIGTTACLGYTGILGIVGYVVIHKATVAFINAHSEYVLLSLAEQVRFVYYTALIGAGIYAICFLRRGIMKAMSIMKSNGDKAGAYIRDAFAEENNGEKWL